MRRLPSILLTLFTLFTLLFVGCGRSALRDSLLDDAGVVDGGPAIPCTTVAECEDRNACTTNRCVNGSCRTTPRDEDGDGVVSSACGGADCDDTNANRRPGAREVCTNQSDDNCDGRSDCADPTCAGQTGCVCGPRELCGNEVDDDCNGQRDCADQTCRNTPACNCGPVEICGNGADDDCNGNTDCDDDVCAGTPACGCNRPEICDNGRDENCNGLVDCDDPACAGQQACVCRESPERCDNGQDDDCDGLVDCGDPNCTGVGSCACVGGPKPEACSNNQDDDCDGLRDCQDTECIGSPACTQCVPEVCNDNRDNDCDGKIDCADDACAFAPNCATKPEVCNNGIDDDRDTLIDCADTDCRTNPLCVLQGKTCVTPRPISASGTFTGDTTGFVGEQTGSCGGAAGEAIFALTITAPSKVVLSTAGSSFDSTIYVRTGACRQGRELACDDDSGGARASRLEFPILYPGTYFVFVDGFTIDRFLGPDEGPYVLTVDITTNPAEVCNNRQDDDGDRLVDCADPGCAGQAPCKTCRNGAPGVAELGVGACSDGIDNDCDGTIDCADSDCRAADSNECCNGIDDNNNGIVDDFACRCISDAQCGAQQLCYTDTVFQCSLPCTNFVGDVCPFVAPGSSCSQATDQCAFP